MSSATSPLNESDVPLLELLLFREIDTWLVPPRLV
jgi:hypothetical protein